MIFFLCVAVSMVQAQVFGLDISQPIDNTKAECLVNANFAFGIVRAWTCGSGAYDSAAGTSIKALRTAGMAHVGAYLYPCVGRSACTSATDQVNEMKRGLEGQGVTIDSLWIDVESGGVCTWTGDNAAFLIEMLAAADAIWGKDKVGIYSSQYMWTTIFGSQTLILDGQEGRKLWFARYDLEPSIGNSFLPFSQWNANNVYAKQYAGNVNVCGHDIDANVAPVFFGLPASTKGAPELSLPCKFNGVDGKCSTESACKDDFVASSQGAIGCQSLSSAFRCCVDVGGVVTPSGATKCTFQGTDGACKATNSCSGSSHPSSTGAMGCEKLPVDVQCCIEGGAAVLPSCTFEGKSGFCKATSSCGGTAHPSKTGATGCEKLPVDVQCCLESAPTECQVQGVRGLCVAPDRCLENSTKAPAATGCEGAGPNVQCCHPHITGSTTCTANGKQGECTAVSKCTGDATPLSRGAKGCEAFTDDVQCCTAKSDPAVDPCAAAQSRTCANGVVQKPTPPSCQAPACPGGEEGTLVDQVPDSASTLRVALGALVFSFVF